MHNLSISFVLSRIGASDSTVFVFVSVILILHSGFRLQSRYDFLFHKLSQNETAKGQMQLDTYSTVYSV